MFLTRYKYQHFNTKFSFLNIKYIKRDIGI